jgi:hypothetical protein
MTEDIARHLTVPALRQAIKNLEQRRIEYINNEDHLPFGGVDRLHTITVIEANIITARRVLEEKINA